MSNKVTKRNAHALIFSGLLVLIISHQFHYGNYHFSMPIVVFFIGYAMTYYGFRLLWRLIARQEGEIAELQRKITDKTN